MPTSGLPPRFGGATRGNEDVGIDAREMELHLIVEAIPMEGAAHLRKFPPCPVKFPFILARFKRRIREITTRAKGVSMETTMEELAPYMRGWRSYFGFCETPEVLIGLTRWVRLRLRAAMWRQWKTPRRRRAALLELGVRPQLASNTAGSGLGPWYLAKAKALSVGLSNAYLKSLGLPTLFEAVLT